MPGLQYKETIAIDSGGYPGEGVGSNGHTNWTDAAMSGTSSVSYYYHDSDYANDSNSSKVTVVITTTWTAVLNNDNSIDVTFSSVIDSLSRGDIRGNPGTIGRTITIYNKPGGSVVWGPQSTAVQTPATYISTDVPIATQTVHIAPQSEANLASLYYLNVMRGYEGRPLPNIGTDAMRMGVFFRNTLPPDYRPGKTWDGNIWQSHNREAGSYIGKNILNPNKVQSSPSHTQGGVTLTKNSDYSFTISGSGTQSGVFGSNWVDYTHAETVALLSGAGTYTLSTTATGAFYPALGVELRQNSSTVSSRWLSGPGSGTVEITQAMIDNPTFNLRFSFYGGSGQTIRPGTFFIQFEKGSTATAYEPYSINYPAGAADIFTSASTKRTMRTQDGASGSGNPPEIYHTPGVKLNMRKIGEHA